MAHLSGSLLQKLLSSAVFAALKASEGIMKIYNSGAFEVSLKSDNSPLTEADRFSQSVIEQVLRQHRIPMLSEEMREVLYIERRDWDLFWLIDPIDGTKEFIKGNGDFTVNIALIENSTPCLGVVLVPAHRQLYFALRDQGAFRLSGYRFSGTKEECAFRTLTQQAERLPLAERSATGCKVLCSLSHLNPKMETYLEMLRMQYPNLTQESRGSSLKFCLVAEGSADIYPRITPTSEWDTAAGQAIVSMAGKQVVEMNRFTPLTYNKENLHNPPFIVRSDASITLPSIDDLEQNIFRK